MKKYVLILIVSVIALACGDSSSTQSSTAADQQKKVEAQPVDDGKGIGPATHVKLNNPLNPEMIASGKGIYEMKCSACHKLSTQRVVGPGWGGVTERRKPEWIMNMTTNVEEMLKNDPTAKEMFKECLVAMPNQNLSSDDARHVLEFMFENDKK